MTHRSTFVTFVILALFAGIVGGFILGAHVATNVAESRIQAVEAERDESVKELRFWRQAMKRLVEGEQPEMMVAGRASEGD